MPDISATEQQISGLATLAGLAIAAGHLFVAAVLVVAARRLGQRLGGAWRHLIWPPIAALVLPGCGIGLTVVLLVRAFQGLAEIDPAARSATLAQRISEAMSATASGVLLAWLLYAGTVVALAIGHLRRARG